MDFVNSYYCRNYGTLLQKDGILVPTIVAELPTFLLLIVVPSLLPPFSLHVWPKTVSKISISGDFPLLR